MRIFNTAKGILLEHEDRWALHADADWDELINREGSTRRCCSLHATLPAHPAPASAVPESVLAPMQGQELWAAGVTYLRSKVERQEESKDAGGVDFYQRVYDAERPELFFKATRHRVVGHGGKVRIRADSSWNVPEPELTLVLNRRGAIVGYTIGNDMSSRSIEGENPLYLSQAKIYDGSAALGPCVLVLRWALSLRCNHRACDPARHADSLYRQRRGQHDHTPVRGPGSLAVPRMQFSPRGFVDDRHRHRSACAFHAAKWRYGQHHD